MLEVRIRRRLGAFQLDAAFSTGAKGITALFGRSGAGKTTVVNALAGLLRPESGRISVGDRVLFDSETGVDLAARHRRVGYVFQEDRLFPHMTVERNLRYGMARNRSTGALTFEQAVDLLDIGALLGRQPRALSGGEKQRVAIGRALLSDPDIVLMDEPLASLDAGRKSEILPFIERLADELRLPVIYVSHQMDEIVRLADSVVIMNDGRVAAVGPLEEVMSRLDLRPLTGRYEAGAVLTTTVREHDLTFGLTRLSTPAGLMWVPHLDAPLHTTLRVRVRARDVSLALSRPTDSSILNVFEGTVKEIGQEDGPQVDVLLDVGAPLWARVTRKSLAELRLAPGSPVFALIKAVAIDRYSVGPGRSGGRLRR